jgi:hypothetical protein
LKINRLWQPRRGIWWLMLAFNVLSSGFAWVLRTWPLTPTGLTVFGLLGLANALCGLWIAARLLRGD